MSNSYQENNCPRLTGNGLFSEPEWDCLIAHLSLAERQAEILHLLLHGENDKQIAQRLGISLPTIRTHLQRIFARFDVSNRTSLVVEVFRQFRTLETEMEYQQEL